MKKPRRKRCKVCKKLFQPERTLQPCCSIPCAIKLVEIKRDKKRRKETRERKEGLKTYRQRLDETETAFRRYIRIRDRVFYAKQGKPPECVSCGNNNPDIQYAAGHFKTKGSHPELRFDERNCNLQCNNRCNKELSGNINGTKDTHGYTSGLEIKYGKDQAEKTLYYLNSYHRPVKYTHEELEEMKKNFNSMALRLEKEYKDLQ